MTATMQGRIHGMWASVATAWETNASSSTRGARPHRAAARPGAPGAGRSRAGAGQRARGLGLAAAGRVGPAGEVVISDVAAPMVAAARARAEAEGSRTSGRGARLRGDRRARRELRRGALPRGADVRDRAGARRRRGAAVLRPGGRVAVAVWGPRERNPWLGVMLDAVGEQLGETLPPPGMPGPFALYDAEGLRTLLADAGLDGVAVGGARGAAARAVARGVVERGCRWPGPSPGASRGCRRRRWPRPATARAPRSRPTPRTTAW